MTEEKKKAIFAIILKTWTSQSALFSVSHHQPNEEERGDEHPIHKGKDLYQLYFALEPIAIMVRFMH